MDLEYYPNSQPVCSTILCHLEYSEYSGLDQPVNTGTTLHHYSAYYDGVADWWVISSLVCICDVIL